MEPGTEQILGDSEGQGSLCCNPWGCKESDTTQRLNNRNGGGWREEARAQVRASGVEQGFLLIRKKERRA